MPGVGRDHVVLYIGLERFRVWGKEPLGLEKFPLSNETERKEGLAVQSDMALLSLAPLTP